MPGSCASRLDVAMAASDCADHLLASQMADVALASGTGTDVRSGLLKVRKALAMGDVKAAAEHVPGLQSNPRDEDARLSALT